MKQTLKFMMKNKQDMLVYLHNKQNYVRMNKLVMIHQQHKGIHFLSNFLCLFRNADLDVLGRLLAYMNENVATFEDYLKDRVNWGSDI